MILAAVPAKSVAQTQANVSTVPGPTTAPDSTRWLAVDFVGNSYVATQDTYSATESHINVSKFDNTGTLLWSKTWPPVSFPDPGLNYPVAITTDPYGSAVFVTGVSPEPGHGKDWVTISLNGASGNEQWIKFHNGTANVDDTPVSIAVSPSSGNVFVVGNMTNNNTSTDIVTIGMHPLTGNDIWPARNVFNRLAINLVDTAADIVVLLSSLGEPEGCPGDEIYVAGTSYGGSFTGNDYVVYRICGTDGSFAWAPAFYMGSSDDRAAGLAVSPRIDSNPTAGVYVTGSSFRAGTAYDYATLGFHKFDGHALWANPRFFDGAAHGKDFARGITLGPSDEGMPEERVYVTGTSHWGAQTGSDMVTLSYWTSTGADGWNGAVDRATEPLFSGTDEGMSIVTYPGGDVYVAGVYTRNIGGKEYITRRLDRGTGAHNWLVNPLLYGNVVPQGTDYALSVRLPANFVAGGPLPSVWVLGRSQAVYGATLDIAVVKYTDP